MSNSYFYLNLKKTKFPKSRDKTRGSRWKIDEDTIREIMATKIPKIVCRRWLFGVVIGSGSITIEKKIIVGSKIEFRIKNLELRIRLTKIYIDKKDNVIR